MCVCACVCVCIGICVVYATILYIIYGMYCMYKAVRNVFCNVILTVADKSFHFVQRHLQTVLLALAFSFNKQFYITVTPARTVSSKLSIILHVVENRLWPRYNTALSAL